MFPFEITKKGMSLFVVELLLEISAFQSSHVFSGFLANFGNFLSEVYFLLDLSVVLKIFLVLFKFIRIVNRVN